MAKLVSELIIVTVIFLSVLQILDLWPGIVTTRLFLWEMFGIEIIEANKTKLDISQEITGWRKSKSYSFERVKSLQTTKKSIRISKNYNEFITFEYDGKICRFGHGIKESEAKEIVSVIQEFVLSLT